MPRLPRRFTTFAAAALLLVGCLSPPAADPDDPLGGEPNVIAWARRASAVSVLLDVGAVLMVAEGETGFTDPDCPMTTDDGVTLVVEGGCTDSTGFEFVGHAQVERREGGLDAVYEGYSRLPNERSTGTITVESESEQLHTYAIDLLREGDSATTTIQYSGQVEVGDSESRWNGAGRFEHSGDESAGTVDAETVDEVTDSSACTESALSGTTTLTGGGHTVVITFDGAESCDGRNRWSRDGEDLGYIEGIVCAIGGDAGACAWPVVLLALASLVLRRRPRR